MNKKINLVIFLVGAILIGTVVQTLGQNVKGQQDERLDAALIEESIANVDANNNAGGTAPPAAIEQVPSPVSLRLFRSYTNSSYVADGTGVRNTGRGTISLRVPKNTVLRDAWLYWIILNTTAGPHDNEITVNGERVTGQLIGSGPSPCWDGTGFAYRANINSVLGDTELKGGDFGMTIGGMSTLFKDGRSPWEITAGLPKAEYVGAVIVYFNPGTFVRIYDGYSEKSGGLANFVVPVGTNRYSSLIGDGQTFFGITPFTKLVNYSVGPTVLQKVTLNGVDPSITSKATNQGSLADTDTFGPLPAAVTGTTLTWNLANDCVSFEALVFTNAGLN